MMGHTQDEHLHYISEQVTSLNGKKENQLGIEPGTSRVNRQCKTNTKPPLKNYIFRWKNYKYSNIDRWLVLILVLLCC